MACGLGSAPATVTRVATDVTTVPPPTSTAADERHYRRGTAPAPPLPAKSQHLSAASGQCQLMKQTPTIQKTINSQGVVEWYV